MIILITKTNKGKITFSTTIGDKDIMFKKLEIIPIIQILRSSVSGKFQAFINVGKSAIKSVIIDIIKPNNGFLVVYQINKEMITIQRTTISNLEVPPNPFFIDRTNITKLVKQIAKANQKAFLSPCAHNVPQANIIIKTIRNQDIL